MQVLLDVCKIRQRSHHRAPKAALPPLTYYLLLSSLKLFLMSRGVQRCQLGHVHHRDSWSQRSTSSWFPSGSTPDARSRPSPALIPTTSTKPAADNCVTSSPASSTTVIAPPSVVVSTTCDAPGGGACVKRPQTRTARPLAACWKNLAFTRSAT